MELDIVHPLINEYLRRTAGPSPGVLEEMERTGAERGFPIVGPLCGRLLHLLARAIGARRVFEMGSGFGYSGIWLAHAVGPGGMVYLTDGKLENAHEAHAHLKTAGLASRAHIFVGDAFDALERVQGAFDFIFCDIDKQSYPKAYRRARPRLRRGGILAFDNMLRDGRVAGGDDDPATEGVRALTRLLIEDETLATVIVPLRDGVSVSLALE